MRTQELKKTNISEVISDTKTSRKTVTKIEKNRRNTSVLIFNIMVTVVIFLIVKFPGEFLRRELLESSGLSYIKVMFLIETMAGLLGVGGLFLVKKQGTLAFSAKGILKGVATGSLMLGLSSLLLLTFLFNHDPFTVSGLDMVLYAIFLVMIGVYEESLFRGILQNAFHEYFGEDSGKNIVTAIVCASVVFGLFHLFNLFSGAGLLQVVIQALSAIGGGMIFGVIYCNSRKNLWLCALIHGFCDGCSFLHGGIFSGRTVVDSINDFSIKNVATIVIYLVIAICLMMTIKTEKAE
ncbi:MAG: CPBP family intramembrane metalloprotease [Lachnospiraceae bacterium]|nr:CPBP family intramembrane metalloprotease [Lachnospiraceae bacterium]